MKADFKLKSEQIQRQGKDPVTVFNLQGWLDAQSEEMLLDAARKSHQSGDRYLIIDLTELAMITSVGIRALQKVQNLFTDKVENALQMRICNAPPEVYHVLKLTGILHDMPVYESLQSALLSYEIK
ncbi:MAG: STAS domain-containing protein [Anaerolineales bacterium]|nr:STAS domain-containing protein [Anaerolineales bacterium]